MTQPAATSAVSHDNLEIPLIDFSAFLHPIAQDSEKDSSSKLPTALAILHGFQTSGFIYLLNHGIPREKIRQAFSLSAKFFQRPPEQKLALGWTTPKANRGYSQPGREKTTDATDPEEIQRIRMAEGQDLKESFEIGREGVDQEGCENLWPDRFDEEGEEEEGEGKVFKREMLEFFELVKQLHVQIMRAIAVGLGIDEYWFDGYTDAGDNTLRLLHYPEVDAEVFRKNRNTVRAGAHTDYGSITCLFQVSFSFFFPNMAEATCGIAASYACCAPIGNLVGLGSACCNWKRTTRRHAFLSRKKKQMRLSFYADCFCCCAGYAWWAAGAQSKRQLHRCHTHRRRHCGECR